jgi:hypothetical protein
MNGYQFEFHCERCGNGYRSPFQPNRKEQGRGLLRAAGSIFGGRASELANAAEMWQYDRSTNSKGKDRALAVAVESVQDEFRQCRGCGDWVCVPVCWNDQVGQCLVCSPSVAEEVSRAQAAAQKDQIWEKAKTVDWTTDVDVTTRAVVTCPTCAAKVDGGKFCSSCGGKLATATFCGNCGSELRAGAMFCSECGTAT